MNTPVAPPTPPKKSRTGLIVTIVLGSIVLLVLAGWLLLSLLSFVFYPKSHAGEREMNALIKDAGLSSVMTAHYKCTGPLPFVEDRCYGSAEVKTDDLATFEKARRLTKEFPHFGRLTLVYKGITYDSGETIPSSEVTEIYQWVKGYSNARNVKVSIGQDTKDISIYIDGIASFNDICRQAFSLVDKGYAQVGITPNTNTRQDPARWSLAGVTSETSRTTLTRVCAVVTDFLKADVSRDVRINVQASGTATTKGKMRVYTGAVYQDSNTEAIKEWFASHPLPEDVVLSVY